MFPWQVPKSLISATFPRLRITSFVRRERIDENNDRLRENTPESRLSKRTKKRRRKRRRKERRKREKQRLSKVQSSSHGAGHYMEFWGYGGGNRLPWDRSFSFSFLLLHLLPLPPFFVFPPPTPPSARSRRQNLYLAAATEMHPRLNGGRAFNGAANCETKNIWFPKEQP